MWQTRDGVRALSTGGRSGAAVPGPSAPAWEWQHAGACRDADPEIFFHPMGERGGAARRRERAAKAVCASCPVVRRCREFALDTRQEYGVWGGLSEIERDAAVRARLTRTA